MTAPTCTCGQPSPDATLCRDCTTTLDAALLQIPGDDGLAYHLGIALARLARFTATSPHRGHVAVLPYDLRAAEAATQLHDVLTGWVRVIHETVRHRLPAATMQAMALWLHARLAQVRQHEAASDIHREITVAVGRAWLVIDRPAQRVYAGPCPVCRTDLLTKPGRTQVTCGGCGTTHDIAERQDHMRTQLDDYLGTATYAAAILPGIGIHVSAGTIRVWASRHRLEVRVVVPAKYGGEDQPLYRLGDIVDLALARDARAGLAMAKHRLSGGPKFRTSAGNFPGRPTFWRIVAGHSVAQTRFPLAVERSKCSRRKRNPAKPLHMPGAKRTSR